MHTGSERDTSEGLHYRLEDITDWRTSQDGSSIPLFQREQAWQFIQRFYTELPWIMIEFTKEKAHAKIHDYHLFRVTPSPRC